MFRGESTNDLISFNTLTKNAIKRKFTILNFLGVFCVFNCVHFMLLFMHIFFDISHIYTKIAVPVKRNTVLNFRVLFCVNLCCPHRTGPPCV